MQKCSKKVKSVALIIKDMTTMFCDAYNINMETIIQYFYIQLIENKQSITNQISIKIFLINKPVFRYWLTWQSKYYKLSLNLKVFRTMLFGIIGPWFLIAFFSVKAHSWFVENYFKNMHIYIIKISGISSLYWYIYNCD